LKETHLRPLPGGGEEVGAEEAVAESGWVRRESSLLIVFAFLWKPALYMEFPL